MRFSFFRITLVYPNYLFEKLVDYGSALNRIFVALLYIIVGMVCVAFFVLFERKLFGLGQGRKGPDKVSFLGILQSFSDVLKLLSKFSVFMRLFDFFLVVFFPMFNVFLLLFFWGLMVGEFGGEGGLFFFCFILVIRSFSGLVVIVSGWSGGSVYRVLGSVRAVVQFLSYEVVFTFFWFFLFFSWGWYGQNFSMVGKFGFLGFLFFFFVYMFSLLAESQRSPFDFPEGESELVSGFNVEFSSVIFTLLFLSEYGLIIFFRLILVVVLFFDFGFLFCCFLNLFLLVLIVVVRSVSPRLRYDLLIIVGWKIILPLRVGFMLLLFILF